MLVLVFSFSFSRLKNLTYPDPTVAPLRWMEVVKDKFQTVLKFDTTSSELQGKRGKGPCGPFPGSVMLQENVNACGSFSGTCSICCHPDNVALRDLRACYTSMDSSYKRTRTRLVEDVSCIKFKIYECLPRKKL